MTTTRSAEWGNWGITFTEWDGERRPYVPRILGTMYFPIGNCGPVDGTLGSLERASNRSIVASWITDGVLPSKLDTSHANETQTSY